MSKITIFQNFNYNGRTLELNESSMDFRMLGFNDTGSSCKIDSGTWILYVDTDYGGKYSILEPGNYASPEAMGIPNDSLSSVRLLPENGICLFKDTNFGNRMLALNRADSDLRNSGFNDQISSVIVLTGSWNLYSNINFHGKKWNLKPGHYPTPDKAGFNNDSISSVQKE